MHRINETKQGQLNRERLCGKDRVYKVVISNNTFDSPRTWHLQLWVRFLSLFSPSTGNLSMTSYSYTLQVGFAFHLNNRNTAFSFFLLTQCWLQRANNFLPLSLSLFLNNPLTPIHNSEVQGCTKKAISLLLLWSTEEWLLLISKNPATNTLQWDGQM